MLSQQHKQRILSRLREEGNELYFAIPRTVEEIVDEVNYELDLGFVFLEDASERLKHRKNKHHQEGIRKVTEKLSQRYGEIYWELIEQAAKQHVIDDMGKIYSEKDYEKPDFWEKWKEGKI